MRMMIIITLSCCFSEQLHTSLCGCSRWFLHRRGRCSIRYTFTRGWVVLVASADTAREVELNYSSLHSARPTSRPMESFTAVLQTNLMRLFWRGQLHEYRLTHLTFPSMRANEWYFSCSVVKLCSLGGIGSKVRLEAFFLFLSPSLIIGQHNLIDYQELKLCWSINRPRKDCAKWEIDSDWIVLSIYCL